MDEKPAARNRKGNGGEPEFAVIDRRPAFTDEAGPSGEARYPTVVEQLKARAEEAERRAREISAAYRNIEGERDAFRARLGRDLERRVHVARAETLRKILAVLDDLDRAIAAGRSARDPDSLVAGVELIRDHLFRALASEGVETIETLGRPYNPSLAEAVAIEETDDPGRDGIVLEEVGKGYVLGDTLLRAAKVRVARRPRAEDQEESGTPIDSSEEALPRS